MKRQSLIGINITLVLLAIIMLFSACKSRPDTSQIEQTSVLLGIEEIHPGILQGYLETKQLPNNLALLPAHPVEGSAAWKDQLHGSCPGRNYIPEGGFEHIIFNL